MSDSQSIPWRAYEPSAQADHAWQRMQCAVDDSQQEDSPASLLVLRIESLGAIGRTYGEELASEILDRVVELIDSLDRPVTRFVHDGVVTVLFTETPLAGATSIADELIAKIKAQDFRMRGRRIGVTASVGVAHTEHSVAFALETLFEVAGEGCEVASSGGGGQCVHTELYDLVEPGAPARTKRTAPAAPTNGDESVARASEPERPRATAIESVRNIDEDGFEIVVPTGAPVVPKDEQFHEISTPAPSSADAPPAVSAADRPPLEIVRSPESENGADEDGSIVDMVSEAFERYSDAGADITVLEDRILSMVMRWSREAERIAVLDTTGRQRREIDLLRRRLNKLSLSLEETERELERVHALKGIEYGVSSVFRRVQGLSQSDSQFALKRELMTKILEANLEFRKTADAR